MSRRRRPARQSKREGRSRWSRRKLAGLLAIIGVIPLAGVLAWFLFIQSSGPSGPPKAAIVDQLSLTFPNPDFVAEATAKLERTGFEVDYFEGEEVTVDFYRDLPKQGYELILFRAHAGRNYIEGEPTEDTSLFTAEPYSKEAHLDDQRQRRLRVAFYTPQDFEEEATYFAIAPEFVRSSMKGDFGGATVVLMGCDVLRGVELATAFADRGAGDIIGWDDQVSASHTDTATGRLLDLMLVDGLDASDAVSQTMAEIGPDPAFGAELFTFR